MPRLRPAWLILITVILTVAAVPELRQQVIEQWQLLPLPSSASRRLHQGGWPGEARRSFALDAAHFVELSHPDNPEMLTAAGVYLGATTKLFEREVRHTNVASTPEAEARRRALSLLKQATEEGGGPVAWAAYAGALAAQARCDRVAAAGVDPEDTDAIAEAERETVAAAAEHHMTSEDAEAVLEALHGWQQADPENGMPFALEGYVLFGVHRDAEALGRWKEASRLPLATDRQGQILRGVVGLMESVGLPGLEAAVEALGAAAEVSTGWSEARACARVAVYEGRLAQIQGRRENAVQLWNTTIEFGRHTQESAGDIVSFLVGSAIASIGASPAWRWLSDKQTGTTGGPLLGGRLWYGPQHEFYVSQVGQRADVELRDSLTASKVRTNLVRDHTSGLLWSSDESLYEFARAVVLPHYGSSAATFIAAMIAAYVIATMWAWRKGDDIMGPLPVRTGGVGPAWLHEALALGGTLVLYISGFEPVMMWTGGVLLCTAVVLIVATVIRQRRRRLPRLPWRTEVRRSAPSVAAAAALVYLATVVIAAHVRPRLAHEITASEMPRMIELVGDAWHSPPVPLDSWRAEYPPELPAQ